MSTKVVTGKVRFSFCHLFEPRANEDGSAPKYSLTLLIPKSDKATLGAIQAAIKDAADAFRAKNGPNSLPPKPSVTLHDGDGLRPNGEEFGPECRGCMVITASSKNPPVVVDEFRNPITDPNEIWSGCYGRAAINFFAYSRNGKKGISAGLQSVQKLYDGEPLGGARGSAGDFDDGWTDSEAADLL